MRDAIGQIKMFLGSKTKQVSLKRLLHHWQSDIGQIKEQQKDDKIASEQGNKYTISCPNGSYVNLDWAKSTFELECGSDGNFITPNPMPACEVRPACPNLTLVELPAAAMLAQPNTTKLYEVSEEVEYWCEDPAWVS
jgi:hypothetical protein